MNSWLRCVIVVLSLALVKPGLAEPSDTDVRDNLKKLTTGLVTEKHDDFDRATTATYSGPDVIIAGNCEVKAFVHWQDGELQQPVCSLGIMRVSSSWRWLKYDETKMLIDGELTPLKYKLSTDVLSAGDVYECQWIEMKIEDAVKWVFADVVKLRVGLDEWTLDAKDRLPMVLAVTHWIAQGGEIKGLKDKLKRLIKPKVGDRFEEVVKWHGEPSQKNPTSGWALWPGFWARFQDGKVVETRPDPELKKAGQ